MIPKLLSTVSWKDAAVGAGAVAVLGTVGRPLLVSGVKFGITTWNEVVAETAKIKQEALCMAAKEQSDQNSISAILAELKELRASVAAVTTAKTPASAKA